MVFPSRALRALARTQNARPLGLMNKMQKIRKKKKNNNIINISRKSVWGVFASISGKENRGLTSYDKSLDFNRLTVQMGVLL
jgi:hypothetical protein